VICFCFDTGPYTCNRKSEGDHTGVIPEGEIEPLKLEEFFTHKLLDWRLHTRMYSGSSLYALYYERLIANPLTELKELYSFLKAYRPDDLTYLDPIKAAQEALKASAGNEKKAKTATNRSLHCYFQTFQ